MADNLFLKIDFGLTPSTDNGVRPYAGAQPLWLNTSIFLSGGTSPSETKVGRPTTVKVRVSNRDPELTVEEVTVDAYVMNPFVGAFVPNNAVVTLSSSGSGIHNISPGSGANSDTDPHVLECKVAGPNGREPWIPTAEELEDTQDGHFCLVANCYADGDGAQAPGGTPFEVANNRRQGQRNIHVLAASNFAPNLLPFLVMPVPEEVEAVLELQPAVLGRLDPGTEDFLAQHPAVLVRGEGPDRRLGVKGRDGEFIPITPADRPLDAKIVLKRPDDDDHHGHHGHDDDHDHDHHDHGHHGHHDDRDRRHDDDDDDDDRGGSGDGGPMPMPTLHRPRRAQLRLAEPLRERVGTLNAFDVVQRTNKGEVLGALRVIALTTVRNPR